MFECLLFLSFLAGCVAASLLMLAGVWWREKSGEGHVQILVLGDAGRSPRMQYHCRSLLQFKYSVELVGYGGSPLIKELRDNPHLSHLKLTEPPAKLNTAPKMLRYVLKVFFQVGNLLWVVFARSTKPSHVIVQTPPSIPTLFVALVTCVLRGSKLIVDYHNYGHTLLALSLGQGHPLVRLAKWYENSLGYFANANLCVSEAMKKDLAVSMGVRAIILYDRPPSIFKPTPVNEAHQLFVRLSEMDPAFRTTHNHLSENYLPSESSTRFTRCSNGVVSLSPRRPFLLVSSTSWTEDEDFGILLSALELYEVMASMEDSALPHVMCVITGKGPLKEHYLSLIAKKQFEHVTITTLWLSTEDYPLLLGSADLGVCLHTSSSGLDLPMKVVDMFGSGLPVCAVKFGCLHELIRHNHNGLTFNDHKELAEQLQALARGFPRKNSRLSRFRDNLSSFQSLRWEHYWRLHVLPLLR